MKIGVFDSGFGGLSIFKAIEQLMPEYDYVYLGDSARAPYGNHSHEQIYLYVLQAVDYLFKEQNCQLVILACNTASAQALRQLQQEWLPIHYPDRRVLGVIRPIAEEVARIAKGKKVGVIGTRATISSHAYQKELDKLTDQYAGVIEKACPLLVPLVEEGFDDRPEMKKILRYYLRPLKLEQINILVNGCTHYQLLEKQIKQIMGKNVEVVDTASIVAQSLLDYLQRHPEHDQKLTKNKERSFLTTDLTERFQQLSGKFLGRSVKTERVKLTKKTS